MMKNNPEIRERFFVQHPLLCRLFVYLAVIGAFFAATGAIPLLLKMRISPHMWIILFVLSLIGIIVCAAVLKIHRHDTHSLVLPGEYLPGTKVDILLLIAIIVLCLVTMDLFAVSFAVFCTQ